MSQIVDLFVPLAGEDERLAQLVSRRLAIPADAIGEIRLLRRSLDARKGHPMGHRLRVEVIMSGENRAPQSPPDTVASWPSSKPSPRIVIVGSGPAGTWAALRLAEAGLPSTILERGRPVQPRRHDLASLQRGRLNPESNYCFGEGSGHLFRRQAVYPYQRPPGGGSHPG